MSVPGKNPNCGQSSERSCKTVTYGMPWSAHTGHGFSLGQRKAPPILLAEGALQLRRYHVWMEVAKSVVCPSACASKRLKSPVHGIGVFVCVSACKQRWVKASPPWRYQSRYVYVAGCKANI